MEAALNQAQTDRVVLDLGLKNSHAVLLRHDIDKFMLDDPVAFNLYLLAIRRLQSQSDVLSYFQIAGIHGLPIQDWDGVIGPKLLWNGPGGYCTHGLLTFPTWHRPYVVQYEQAIINAAIDIAKQDFSNSRTYQQAAERIRVPYWDPYRPRGGRVSFPGVGGTTSFPYDFKLPQIMTQEQIAVLLKEEDTNLTHIPNPLYRFNFPASGGISTQDWDLVNQGLNPTFWDRWTTRNPDNGDASNSNTNAMNENLNQAREGLVGNMFNLLFLDDYKDYRMFSNHSTQSGLANGSIEGFHDQYHGIIGGSAGHMSYPPIAAFDPVFWLHHCNIDRLLAIWQAINKDTWWPKNLDSTEPESTTPLTPFRHDAGDTDWWTSDSSRKWTDFGYTYSELDITDSNALVQDIGRRYNWSRQGFFQPGVGPKPPSDMDVLNVAGAAPFAPNGSAVLPQLLPGVTATEAVRSSAAHRAGAVLGSTKEAVTSATSNSPALAKGATSVGGDRKETEGQTPLVEEKPSIPEGATLIRNWYVDTEAKRMALQGTFTVYFFIGPFDDIPAAYKSRPSFAGAAHFFIAPPKACDNCMQQGMAGATVANTTTITPILHDYVNKGTGDYRLASLEPDDVKPFLAKNLSWRVLNAPGRGDHGADQFPVDIKAIDGFKIHINSDLSYLEEGSYLPVPVGQEGYDDLAEQITKEQEESQSLFLIPAAFISEDKD